MLAENILSWVQKLRIDPALLPDNLRVMNPYRDMSPAAYAAMERFYRRFYADDQPRRLILGINPGRLGAGQTGVPFTDTLHLEKIGIEMPDVRTVEPSADFVWRVVDRSGGPDRFFGWHFIGAVSPLGFVRKNNKGNWVNFNYYDDPIVERALTPFIVEQISKQKEIAGNPRQAVVLGTGKNFQFLNKLNDRYHWFESITALEHPRFIVQYRRKLMPDYIEKYLDVLA